MKRFLFILTLLCVAGTMTVSAQGTEGKKSAVSFVNLTDSADVYKALYDNTPIEPEFKLAPKFAIVGADGKFVFSTGATMKFTASYDWGNPVRNPMGMGVSEIKPALFDDNHLYQMSAGGSGIFFNIIGLPNSANQIGLFISIGVDNESNNTYKLSAGQVYMRYRDFQLGYSTSLYNDRAADAYTIDAHGPCASGTHSTVGINWQHFFNKHIRMGVGVELPKPSYTQIIPENVTPGEGALLYTATSCQTMPDFPLYLGYAWDTGHLRLSTIVRCIRYIDYYTGLKHTKVGNALKLTGKSVFGPVSLFGMAQIGWGSASYFLDNSSAGLDLVPDQNTPGRLIPTKNWGCIAAAQWNITPKIFTTVQFSYLRNYIPAYYCDATTDYDDQMRRGYTVTGNAIWKISRLFSTGLEYRFGRRTAESHHSYSNNRVYAMFLMTF